MLSLSPDFWSAERERLLAVILPVVQDAAVAGVISQAFRISFDNDQANQQAANWARQYTDELLNLMGTTNQQVVGEVLAQWIRQPGSTMGELKDLLSNAFPPERADLIAVTETTRAYSQGNAVAFRQAGITHWKWNTNRDELVCPVCGPLNGKVVEIGQSFGIFRGKQVFSQPPAHPGCRCWTSPVARSRLSQ